MASTKYRKREKPTAPNGETNEPESNKRASGGKVLDVEPSKVVDSRIHETNERIAKANGYEAPQKTQADPETGETLLDCIKTEDERNRFEMKIIKQANRLTRIAIFLNGIEVRPHTYTGSNAATSYFNLLKTSKKA